MSKKNPSKKVCVNERVMVGGVDVSDHVSEVTSRFKVGELIEATVTFQGVRIEEEADLSQPSGFRQVFHLVEREVKP